MFGLGNLFTMPLKGFSALLQPFRAMGGPMGSMAATHQYNAANPINPFSIGSIPKAGQNAIGGMNAAFGGWNPGGGMGGQQNQQLMSLLKLMSLGDMMTRRR